MNDKELADLLRDSSPNELWVVTWNNLLKIVNMRSFLLFFLSFNALFELKFYIITSPIVLNIQTLTHQYK